MNDVLKAILEKNDKLSDMYGQRVTELIRTKYDLNAELAILRQRDEKPEEFAEYNAFAEDCKAQAKKEIYGRDVL